MPQPYVHPFYRIWFTWIDPVTLVPTVLACIFSKKAFLEMLLPPPIPAIDALHSVLLHQTAALYGFMCITFAVLLRVSSDRKVWRTIQATVLAVDVSLFITGLVNLQEQGRLSLDKLVGFDFMGLGFTAVVALIRAGFLLGIGGGDGARAKKEL
jgi:hypothetical protein